MKQKTTILECSDKFKTEFANNEFDKIPEYEQEYILEFFTNHGVIMYGELPINLDIDNMCWFVET